MKLKRNIDFVDFLKTIAQCESEVYFDSVDGDHLNLKSTLSRFLFSTVSNNSDILDKGTIVCSCETDINLLKQYLI